MKVVNKITRTLLHENSSRLFPRYFSTGVDSKKPSSRVPIEEVPSLKDFMKSQQEPHHHQHNKDDESKLQEEEDVSSLPEYLHIEREQNKNKTYHVETHGCQMNVADTEIVQTILEGAGFTHTDQKESADVILLNTCAIREGAEKKVWNKLES